MKRFLLFRGDTYYPGGGWDDYVKDFDSNEEARAFTGSDRYDWQQVVDTEQLSEVNARGDVIT